MKDYSVQKGVSIAKEYYENGSSALYLKCRKNSVWSLLYVMYQYRCCLAKGHAECPTIYTPDVVDEARQTLLRSHKKA
jgi:hypothetical protein